MGLGLSCLCFVKTIISVVFCHFGVTGVLRGDLCEDPTDLHRPSSGSDLDLHSKTTREPIVAILVVALDEPPGPRLRCPAAENGGNMRHGLRRGNRGYRRAYLGRRSLRRSQNHQLDGPSQVALHGHGTPQGLHGVMVGATNK